MRLARLGSGGLGAGVYVLFLQFGVQGVSSSCPRSLHIFAPKTTHVLVSIHNILNEHGPLRRSAVKRHEVAGASISTGRNGRHDPDIGRCTWLPGALSASCCRVPLMPCSSAVLPSWNISRDRPRPVLLPTSLSASPLQPGTDQCLSTLLPDTHHTSAPASRAAHPEGSQRQSPLPSRLSVDHLCFL